MMQTTGTAQIFSESRVEDFSRYEFKYILNEQERSEVEEEVSHFMQYDGHVSEQLENAYLVRSLYFDNPESVNYYEKIDGLRSRRKYRLRTYGDSWSPDVPIYLEEKGRHKERTFKHRIRIRHKELPLFYSMSKRFDLLSLYPNTPLIENFIFNSTRRSTDPVVLVDYLRRPYMSPYDTNFRITFDARLVATPASALFPNSGNLWKACDAGYTIVETKFFRRIPAWFHRIIQAHNLRRLSVSKFCRGMEVCSLAENLE